MTFADRQATASCGNGLGQFVEQNLKTGQALVEEIFHFVLDATGIFVGGFGDLTSTLFGRTHHFGPLDETFGLHFGGFNDFIGLTASTSDEFIALFHHPAGLTQFVGQTMQSLFENLDEVLATNPKSVEEFRAGKDKAFNALVGQIMKASKGKANPQQVNDLLRQKLG